MAGDEKLEAGLKRGLVRGDSLGNNLYVSYGLQGLGSCAWTELKSGRILSNYDEKKGSQAMCMLARDCLAKETKLN